MDKVIDSETIHVGTILSGGSTSESAFQPLGKFENDLIEGKLVVVHYERTSSEVLGRISSIIPYNAFYSEGDAFSEARRKGMPIPNEVAKQYQICKIDLLLDLGTRRSVTFPPHPGDLVSLYNPVEHEEKLFGMKRGKGDEKHVWFGNQIGYSNAPVALSVEHMPMHMAVFGVTGSGKSYNMGSILECLAKVPFRYDGKMKTCVPYPMLIIDANSDYSDYAELNQTCEIGALGNKEISRVFFPKSYEREQIKGGSHALQRMAVNLNILSSRDLAQMVMEFYRGSSEGVSELGISALQRMIENLNEGGLTNQDLFTISVQNLRKAINSPKEEIHSSTKQAMLRAIDIFTRRMGEETGLLTERSCDWFNIEDRIDELTKGKIAILDFSADGATGIDPPTKQLVIGYLSAVLFQKFTKYKQEADARYLSFIIEEAQNFCPGSRYPIGSSLAKRKLSEIATQGRKFGLSLCLISQRPSFVDEIILSMCNTFFIHRISPDDVSFVKSVTGGLPDSLSRRLTNLSQGECIITGQMNKLPFGVLVRGQERTIRHTAGTTNVVARLADLRGI